MDGFMLIFLLSPRRLILRAAGLKKREEAAGRRILPDPVLFGDAEFEKCSPICQRHFRTHDAVIRVYDAAGNVTETHEQLASFANSDYFKPGIKCEATLLGRLP